MTGGAMLVTRVVTLALGTLEPSSVMLSAVGGNKVSAFRCLCVPVPVCPVSLGCEIRGERSVDRVVTTHK